MAPLLAAKRPENLARLYARGTDEKLINPTPKQTAALHAICSNEPRYSQLIFKTPRGGSKTILCAVGFAWLHLTDPTWKILVHSGSYEQATYLYSYYHPLITNPELFPPNWLKHEPTKGLTEFKQGGFLRVLTASERQSRGPHPDIFTLDEAVLIKKDLIDAIWPTVNTSSRPKRIILSTASNTMGAWSLDWFTNIWQKSSELGFERFGWNRTDCPWLNQEDAKRVQLLYGVDSQTWRTEFEGEIAEKSGLVWDPLLIDGEPTPDHPHPIALVDVENQDEYPLPLAPPATEWSQGLDWGFTHPTVLTIWEKQGETVFARRLKIWYQESFTEIRQEIHANNPDVTVYADSSSPGENEDLHRLGQHVQPVIFSEDKEELINHVRWRLENGFLKIPNTPEFEPLIRQMRSYHYVQSRTGGSQGLPKPAKIDDDCVDSMLCGMKPWMRDTRGMFRMRGVRPNR